MKKYVFLSFVLFACKTSTEDRIKKAAQTIEVDRFNQNNQKLEKLSIDSLEYNLANVQLYLMEEESSLMSTETKYNDIMMEEIKIRSNDSNISKTRGLIEDLDKRVNKIGDLMKQADTAHNLYRVKYKIAAKTNQASYNEERIRYLNVRDLSHFSMDFSH